MSFVDEIRKGPEVLLKGLKLKARYKGSKEIYPVYEIDMDVEDNNGKLYFMIKREEERIKEHIAKGEHWCPSCGTVWPDVWVTLDDVDIIVEEFDVR